MLVATTDAAVFSIFRPDLGRAMIGRQDGVLHVLDLERRSEEQRITAHRGAVHAIAGLDDRRLATAGADGVLAILERATMELQRSIPIADEKLRAIAVAPGGSHLALACGDGTVRVLEAVDLNEIHTFHGHEGGATAVAWHPWRPVLCSGGKDGHLRCWSMQSGTQVLGVPIHRSTVYAIVFNGDGSLMASCSRDRTVKVWDARTFEPVQRLDRSSGGHSHSVNALLWSGGTLLSAGDDRTIVAWDQNG